MIIEPLPASRFIGHAKRILRIAREWQEAAEEYPGDKVWQDTCAAHVERLRDNARATLRFARPTI